MLTQRKLKFPPYSRPLFDLLRAGYPAPELICIFIGILAWKKGKKGSDMNPVGGFILPMWVNPFDYSYPVFECNVLIIDTGCCEEEYIESLAFCLLKEGASHVSYCSPEYNLTRFLRD